MDAGEDCQALIETLPMIWSYRESRHRLAGSWKSDLSLSFSRMNVAKIGFDSSFT
jgi:hypothetical protein